ncbi:MAG: NAD(P)/FAD-dependent oxidoreductase [Saprospiraceae bacterium]|nr:NAD(P)/FAD-dependent oxidoreductase [Saprospiraceae bacterium]
MIQSYKKQYTTQETYDTIIIGSGMGGLSTGVLLAKAGYRILMLERHYKAGGFTHTFKRRGYEFDVGIHYIGSVGRSKDMLKKVMDYISDGKLQWADMGHVYDKIMIGEQTFDFVKGVDNWINQMVQYFPKEEQAIRKYVDLIFKAVDSSKSYYLEKALPSIPSKIIGPFLRRPYLKYARKTTQEVLSTVTNNPLLIKVLTGQYGDYGLAPQRSSFAMHAALVRHFFEGGYYPVGGASQILKHTAPIICKQGDILVNAEVKQVLIEKNKAIGVQMKDGKVFKAKHIVSNAGIMTTYNKLLPKEIFQKHQLNRIIKKVNPSLAHLCLYVGLKGDVEENKLQKANYWIYPDKGSHDDCVNAYLADVNEEFPVVYISFPSSKDPDWKNRYPNKSAIDIITLVPYEIFAPWEDKSWKKRGQDYEELKEYFAQRLLEVLYQKEPQLRGKVDFYELSSPITTRHFINYEKGEIYGLDHDPNRFQQKFLKPRTPIKNLYLTGQDISTAGIGGAAISGLLTASVVSGQNMLKTVFRKKPNT